MGMGLHGERRTGGHIRGKLYEIMIMEKRYHKVLKYRIKGETSKSPNASSHYLCAIAFRASSHLRWSTDWR